ncbi:MAG TPA: hypothetical protein PLP25_02005 [Candidatus Limiplasma sp.]|mgnify:CR=1 FL=1|nr:hypothetical protein [Candidatus Limiplasma sp.]HPS80620.1 hypothetical protein [Candidatus Limiplasma sp.]
MKQLFLRRLPALAMALCLCLLPTLSLADTFLPDGDVTHVDFTLGLQLHADGFPASKAHLSDWETFLNKIDLRGSMDALAMLTPQSRVYLNGAIRLNGKDQVPFVYDGYHSYRYLLSPALGNEVLFFQMHNFLEFMLKPYYYMELPTQYLALLMYPEAAYAIGDEYYSPIAAMIENAKQAAINGVAPDAEAGEDADMAEDSETDEGEADAALADGAEPEAAADATVAAETPVPAVAADGTVTFTVPYESLYEQCENLDLIVNDDPDLERAYFFFTCLLTELYASDMTLNTLGALEDVLDALDPDQQGMKVVQSPTGMTCTLGDTDVFVKTTDGDATAFTFTLPTPDGYQVTFDYGWKPQTLGATLNAKLTVLEDGEPSIVVTADGEGMPKEGDLSGEGKLTLSASGSAFDSPVAPFTLAFNWVRDAVQPPYTLDVTLDWLHPQTGKAAVSAHFNGTFNLADKSVFVEGDYPQNDFFNLNETFLEGYKERLLPSLALKFAPILLETPAGVLNDLYDFASKSNILVSFVE